MMFAFLVTAVTLGGIGTIAYCLVLARRHRMVIRVIGRSMLPGFRPGDRVLLRRASAGQLAVGMVAVARAPRRIPALTGTALEGPLWVSRRWVIKRVAALPGDAVPESVEAAAGGLTVVPAGKLVLLSDNPGGGRDSRHWGLVAADDLLGYVVRRLR